MRREQLLPCVALVLVVSLPWAPAQAQTAKSEGGAAGAAVKVDKPLPNFPLRYSGAGRFLHTEIPSFQLVARYTFDMKAGVNREVATFIDHEIEIFNVYDMDPSDGVDPDREYLNISSSAIRRPASCTAHSTSPPSPTCSAATGG